jgi:hypothetical protein
VKTHDDYLPNASNGKTLAAWLQNNGEKEFSAENLEKAYQDLKQSGLLMLKAEGADEPTGDESKDAVRIEQPKPEATQVRSPRSSTLSTRSRRVAEVKTGPTEDEAYAMPMDKLRELANKQLTTARE